MIQHSHPLPAGLRGRAILGICASGAAAEARFAVDPDYQRRLEDAGVCVSQAYYEQITPELLAAQDLVFLTGFPKTDAPEYAEAVLRDKAPMLDAFVKNGGGLLVFVDDHYARLFETLNRLLAPYGAEVLCELLYDKNRSNAGEWPSSPEIATLLTRNINHPLAEGIESLRLPNGWQSGIWPLKFHSADWQAVFSGESTVESRVLWQENVATYPSAPPLCGVREWGSGRIGIFPVHPTFCIGNGYHRRWGGSFFRSPDSDLFLANLLEWLGEKSRRAEAARPLCLIAKDQTMNWFQTISASDQPIQYPAHKGIFGLRSNLSGGSHSVDELCAAAREAGFSWVAFAEREEELGTGGWEKLTAACVQASNEDFSALPGVDFAARNDFGNRGVVICPRYWPRKQENLRFIIQMIEEGGGMLIFSNPATCPLPAWNNGGFQAMEVVRYDASGNLLESSFDLYARLQSHDWFQVPITRFDVSTPEEIHLVAAKPGVFHTFISAPRAGLVSQFLPRVEGMEYQEVFISSGPVIQEFWIEGKGCIKDVWEGRYYVWSGDVSEELSLHLNCASTDPLAEVSVWDDSRVCARFFPGSPHLETVIPRPNDRTCRSYRIVAKDARGNEAWSMARRVRNNRFQAHGGGDRMNTYGSHYFVHPQGEFTLLGERCSASGTMLFGLGWRQHHLNIYPPVATLDFHPEGGEWGAPAGRLERVHLNPVIRTTDGVEIERPLESRLGFSFAGQEVALVHDRVTAKEHIMPDSVLEGYIPYPRPHLEKCSPGLAIWKETDLIEEEVSYSFGRWRPAGGPIVLRMDATVTARKELEIKAGDELGLRILRIESDLDRFLDKLHFLAADGRPRTVDLSDGLTTYDLGPNGFAAMTEQPYGSFGIFQISGDAFSVRCGKLDGVCEMQVGWRFADGTKFPAGHRWTSSLLLVVTGNPRGGGYFAGLHDALARNPESRWTMKSGQLTGVGYPVEMAADNHAVEFLRDPHPGLAAAGVDELVKISGVNPQWSALAFIRRTHAWTPLSMHECAAYWTLPDSPLDAIAGHPLVCTSALVHLDVTPETDGLHCRASNPTPTTIEALIHTNPAFHGVLHPQEKPLSLAPGASAAWHFPAL